MALIEVRRLTKLYRMGDSVVRALDGVDLDVERGEFVAITGPSGSGKSTMMHLLGCLDRPTSGTYRLDGRDVSRMSERQLAAIRNRQIGFVFQTFNLMNRTSALDNVGVPLFYARRANTRTPSRRALERVGLGHRATHRPAELSGGERQRVAIARAIVNDPLLLLADEPTGNLDTRTGEQIMQIFHELNAQGVTIVLVTHEPDVALQAQRVVQMRDGKIISDRLTRDILGQLDDRGAHRPPATAPVLLSASEASASRSAAALLARPVPACAVSVPESGAPDDGREGSAPHRGAAVSGTAAGISNAGGGCDLGPPRMARGATAALVCGCVAPLLALGAWVAGMSLRASLRGHPAPTREIGTIGAVIMLGLLLAVVLGVTAMVSGRGVLRRIYNEPGNWVGARRARLAVVLGLLGVVSPLVIFGLGRALG